VIALRADLHVHSCLSPCGSLLMSPSLIARRGREAGLDAVALTDHNSALNCPAFVECCRDEGIVALCGLEVTTREEAHIVCLFDNAQAALDLGTWIYRLLPARENVPEKLGDQVHVDRNEEILGVVDKILTAAADVPADELAARVCRGGGAVVPAHVDRPSWSLVSQLGFLPDGPWAAVETARVPCRVDTRGYPVITSSDAHEPDQIGEASSVFQCRERSAAAVLEALRDLRTRPGVLRPRP
jgi:3',5'-nucleoside bisphosphate phosphatase